MIDAVQFILLLVIVLLTVLLLVLGIQVYFILRELRKTVGKANKVLDHADVITETVSAPLESLASLTGIKATSLISVVKIVRRFLDRHDDRS